MADQAVPPDSVDQDVMVDDAVSRGVTVDGAALGGAGVQEEVGELRDEVETGAKVDADAFADDSVTSTVSSISIA
jgi:hypothetical protein